MLGVRKLLIVIIVLYAVWRVLTIVGRRLRRSSSGAESFSRFSGRRASPRTEPERLIPCDRCGTLLPASRTLPGPGSHHYCSEACRDRAEKESRHAPNGG